MFDFISDRLLAQLDGAVAGTTILVPGARLIPLASFERLRQLAQAGAVVVFTGDLPRDVPGLGDSTVAGPGCARPWRRWGRASGWARTCVPGWWGKGASWWRPARRRR